jgi:hypothetical protein
VNLPFWGAKTNGGILYKSIPFWIGKAFLKTVNPVVGLENKHSANIIGYLAQDYF